MLPVPIVDLIAGTTLKATWVNSGVIPTSLSSGLYDPNETLVGSFNALTSGNSLNGHFFGLHYVPTSYPWYVNKWFAFIDANTYVYGQLVRARKLEV